MTVSIELESSEVGEREGSEMAYESRFLRKQSRPGEVRAA